MGQVADLLRASLARLDTARYELRATDINDAFTFMGEGARLLSIAIPQVDVLEAQTPGPDPEPGNDDEDWANLLSGAPGLAGRQKWLAGSTGCDLFVRRGTVVRAPQEGTFHFQMLPVPGIGAIGEWMLEYPDGRAVRGRHCAQPQVANGARVTRGQPLCIVSDQTMDMLRWPAGYPAPPDGYQHLDISLASSVSRLNPAGGAGGDVDADTHIWSKGGIPNIRLIDRTPGPMEGSRGTLRAQWAAWAEQEIPA
jgi:hypothetical protein